jgi:bacterioferritin-associated ferredoxin
MIICSCNVLSDQDIRNAMTTSAPPRTMGGLFRYFGFRAECGCCARSIKRVMDLAATTKSLGRDSLNVASRCEPIPERLAGGSGPAAIRSERRSSYDRARS